MELSDGSVPFLEHIFLDGSSHLDAFGVDSLFDDHLSENSSASSDDAPSLDDGLSVGDDCSVSNDFPGNGCAWLLLDDPCESSDVSLDSAEVSVATDEVSVGDNSLEEDLLLFSGWLNVLSLELLPDESDGSSVLSDDSDSSDSLDDLSVCHTSFADVSFLSNQFLLDDSSLLLVLNDLLTEDFLLGWFSFLDFLLDLSDTFDVLGNNSGSDSVPSNDLLLASSPLDDLPVSDDLLDGSVLDDNLAVLLSDHSSLGDVGGSDESGVSSESSGHFSGELFALLAFAELDDSVLSELGSVDSSSDDLSDLGILGVLPLLLQLGDSLAILLDEWSGEFLDQVGGAFAD